MSVTLHYQTMGKKVKRQTVGQFITVTRRDDGSLRLNFKHLQTGADFSIGRYAAGVCNEIIKALVGLVEET